jgi:hypothetical protein
MIHLPAHVHMEFMAAEMPETPAIRAEPGQKQTNEPSEGSTAFGPSAWTPPQANDLFLSHRPALEIADLHRYEQ